MKNLICTFLLIFCLTGFSQGKGEIKIQKSKLSEAKTIYDLINEIPKDCKVNSFIFSSNIGGVLKEFSSLGGEFSKEFKDFLRKAEKGNKLFFEAINSSCPKSHKKNYKIIVE